MSDGPRRGHVGSGAVARPSPSDERAMAAAAPLHAGDAARDDDEHARGPADLEDDDDLLPELPPLGSELDEDEAVGLGEPDTGEDVARADDGGETLGLDDGTPDDLDPSFGEVLPGLGDAPESGLLEGTEEGGDAVGGLGEGLDQVDDGTAESGWTEGTESADDLDFDLDPEPGRDGEGDASVLDDRGEEGLLDEALLPRDGNEDAFAGADLGPLDADPDEGPPDDGLLGDEELSLGPELSWEDELALMGRDLPASLPPDALAAERIEVADDVLTAVAVGAGGTVWAAGLGLYRLTGGALAPLPARGLPDDEITTLAPHPGDPDRMAVGTRLGGAFRSTDGGRTFTAANGWWHRAEEPPVAFEVLAEAIADGDARLWGRTTAGALWRSEDWGETWAGPLLPQPVRALAAWGGGPGVVALTASLVGASNLLRSDDGGRGWRAVDASLPRGGAAGDDGDAPHLAALGDDVFLATPWDVRQVFHWERGTRLDDLPALPRAGALAAAREGDRVVLYAAAFFDAGGHAVVFRARPGEDRAARVLEGTAPERAGGPEDPERRGRFHALVARPGDDATTLYVAGAGGLHVVRVKRGDG